MPDGSREAGYDAGMNETLNDPDGCLIPGDSHNPDGAYDGLAADHILTAEGQAEVFENMPEPGDDVVEVPA